MQNKTFPHILIKSSPGQSGLYSQDIMPIKKFISFVAKNDREFFFYRNVIMSSIKFVEFVTIFVLSRELKEQY